VSATPALRPWQRLGVRLAAYFALAALIAVGAVGFLAYARQRHEVEDTVGTQLLNIARTGALLVDPAVHADVARTRVTGSPAYLRVQRDLAAIQREVLLTTPIYTLADLDPARREARVVVVSDEPGRPGQMLALAPELLEPLGWTFQDGVARYTRIYRNASGTWISAFAPILDPAGQTAAVLAMDYPVEIYLDRLGELRTALVRASIAGALAALVLGALVASRLTRPIRALTAGVRRVADGDLSQALPVQSRDEVGQLTRAFNGMLEGLRQRDFIRSAFGRYVSPEVAKTLLDSPEGLRFGGEKRIITVLMSDLRGYTRFAEQGEPEQVMDLLNGYLSRMTDIIIEHGGTINEFIGDAIFAVFGAPLAHADHAERAAGAALAMQGAMAEINASHAARGLPCLEMGIGLNTGEAVVGNIGSEQRAKYAVVGSAVNIAARVEGATVGGQVFMSAATFERIRDLAEVGEPLSVAVKGIAEPLVLYDLRGLSGRFARRRTDTDVDGSAAADVALPLACRVIEGKIVGDEAIGGVVVRLGRHHLDAQLDRRLAPLTNVRLRVTCPALGIESGDLYGKVTLAPAGDDPGATRIRLTWVDGADQRTIEAIVAPPAPADPVATAP
jgi:class 3 adenylate cyclase